MRYGSINIFTKLKAAVIHVWVANYYRSLVSLIGKGPKSLE